MGKSVGRGFGAIALLVVCTCLAPQAANAGAPSDAWSTPWTTEVQYAFRYNGYEGSIVVHGGFPDAASDSTAEVCVWLQRTSDLPDGSRPHENIEGCAHPLRSDDYSFYPGRWKATAHATLDLTYYRRAPFGDSRVVESPYGGVRIDLTWSGVGRPSVKPDTSVHPTGSPVNNQSSIEKAASVTGSIVMPDVVIRVKDAPGRMRLI